MPRDGSGASHNVVEAGDHIIHGSGDGDGKPNTSSGVDRSNKAAPPPAPEKGEALENMNASGGGNSGPASGNTGSGKGPKDP